MSPAPRWGAAKQSQDFLQKIALPELGFDYVEEKASPESLQLQVKAKELKEELFQLLKLEVNKDLEKQNLYLKHQSS